MEKKRTVPLFEPSPFSQKIFIMLTGPSACGKSSTAKILASNFNLGIIHNDSIMGEVFERAGMSKEWRNKISRIDEWWPIVDKKTNCACAKLIQEFHQNSCHKLAGKPLILAEGYLYSFRKYRLEVYKTLQTFGFVLIHYCPPKEEQIKRYLERNKNHPDLINQSADGREAHARRYLNLQHDSFQPPDTNEPTEYYKLDDLGIRQLLEKIRGRR